MMVGGRYNFGEWEMNELARRLAEAGKREAAIAILGVNGEFYPRSAEIDFQLGELTLALGARDDALRHFRAAVEKSPDHARARQRIAEIERR
jgi:tetratricopeptide (TPR) repeat protein